jgi:hypothetical protein
VELLLLFQQVKIVLRLWLKQLGKGIQSRVSRIERDYLIFGDTRRRPQQYSLTSVNSEAATLRGVLLSYILFILFRKTHQHLRPTTHRGHAR